VFDSRRRHFISVCNQPPRSTQPSTLRRTVKWVPRDGGALCIAIAERFGKCYSIYRRFTNVQVYFTFLLRNGCWIGDGDGGVRRNYYRPDNGSVGHMGHESNGSWVKWVNNTGWVTWVTGQYLWPIDPWVINRWLSQSHFKNDFNNFWY